MKKNFLSIDDVSDEELTWLVDKSIEFANRSDSTTPFLGKIAAMIFEKPSLRTKVSFDIACYELGGHGIYLSSDEVGLDLREPVEDVAKVLSSWAALIVARVNSHSTLDRLSVSSSIPVINALSDIEHPCQALADILTVKQKFGSIQGLNIAYVGDANNCALSLGLAAVSQGANYKIISPEAYGFSANDQHKILARASGEKNAEVEFYTGTSPKDAIEGSHVIYTDVWTSMGQESETETRKSAFQGFQVNEKLLELADREAIVLHPMPVHYGEEMSLGMLDHSQSRAYQQAENRLHAQKAIITYLMSSV